MSSEFHVRNDTALLGELFRPGAISRLLMKLELMVHIMVSERLLFVPLL